VLQDWRQTQRNLADTEARMTAVLDELHLTVITTGRIWDPITAAPSVVRSTRLCAAGTNPITAMQGLTTDEAPTKGLTLNALR
jgi:hypothetical protein